MNKASIIQNVIINIMTVCWGYIKNGLIIIITNKFYLNILISNHLT